jgi:hypothetical protein
MNGKNKRRRVKVPPFAVGGKVYVQFGNQKRLARIVEDRGTIGRGGRRLLRVMFPGGDDAAEQSFEIPAAEVTRAPSPTRRLQTIKAKAAHA